MRLIELFPSVPSNQIAPSSQMNQVGALRGEPSLSTVAKFAINGSGSISLGLNSLGLKKANQALSRMQFLVRRLTKFDDRIGLTAVVPAHAVERLLPTAECPKIWSLL